MFGATKAAGWFGWGGLGMPTLANGEGAWDWTPTHPSSSSATIPIACGDGFYVFVSSPQVFVKTPPLPD